MTTERCPSCGGAVRPGAPWCTCCWADLRPKPAPPPPPPVPAPVAPVAPVAGVPPLAAPAAYTAGYPAAYPAGYPGAELGWPLGAYGEPGAGVPANVAAGALLMAPSTPVSPVAPLPVAPVPGVDPLTAPLPALLGQPLAADPGAPAAVSWPCVECGESNSIDRETCGVCTAPFGGRIARLHDVKGARRKYFVMSIGGVVLFLMMLALLTFATTGSNTADPSTGITDPSLETTIDYSTLPEG